MFVEERWLDRERVVEWAKSVLRREEEEGKERWRKGMGREKAEVEKGDGGGKERWRKGMGEERKGGERGRGGRKDGGGKEKWRKI